MSDSPTTLETEHQPAAPGPPPPTTLADPTWPKPRPTFADVSIPQALALLVAAVLVDLAIRSGVATTSSSLATIAIALPVLGSLYRKQRIATVFAAAAIVFALALPLRASTWLIGLNGLAVVACLLLASATVRPVRWRVGTQTLLILVQRMTLARFFGSILRSAAQPLRPTRASRLLPILRGIVIAIVPITILGALLAAADEVFAQAFSVELDPSGFFEHLFLIAFAVAFIAGLVAIAGSPVAESAPDLRPLGTTEALVLLTGVGGLYAAFSLVQLSTALGHNDDVLRERGLTFAEYARSGFFQLLWVAGLTVVLLATVRLIVRTGSRQIDVAVRIAGALVSLLTIVIVVVAILRLGLYTDEFGQTTLRWYCTAFAWLLGALFVVFAAAHLPRFENWAVPVALGLVAATLLAINVLNPEARVANHNLTRADAAESLDAEYLTLLSADAWLEIRNHQQLVTSRLAGGDAMFAVRCGQADAPAPYGPFGFNLARSRLEC